MRFTEQQHGPRQVWQHADDLLEPDHLAEILAAAARSGNRVLLPTLPRLSRAGRLRVLSMQREPFEGGVSGARLERVQVEVEVASSHDLPETATLALVLKRMAPATSWLMRSSGDTHCREVQLWRAGVLDDVPPAFLLPILAAAYDEQAGEGALLMADVSRWLGNFADCFLLVAPRRRALHLDHLARLHARFWGDARLGDTTLGLATPERALLVLSPAAIAAERASGDAHPYLAAAEAGWQAFFDNSSSDSRILIQRVLDHPAAFLASAAAVPATLVHGDVWPPNLGLWQSEPGGTGRPPKKRTLLIDWALATAGPATYDLLWLLFYWRRVVPHEALGYYHRRLATHLARRGMQVSAAEWELLLDLAAVRTVLACGETLGQAVVHAADEASRRAALAALHWWVGWISLKIARRGWDA